MVNLASNLVDTANGHADRVAVRVNETAVTYEDLAQASSRGCCAASKRRSGARSWLPGNDRDGPHGLTITTAPAGPAPR
jgi:hypothetical protein